MLNQKIKKRIFSLSKIKIFNLGIVLLYKIVNPFSSAGIRKFFYKFPVNGKVKAQVPGSKPFIMANDGSDSIANDIYWKGIYGYEKNNHELNSKIAG